MKNLKAAKVLLCITGILMFILGVVTLLLPMATLFTIAILLGCGFLITGIVCIVSFFTEKNRLTSPGWILVQGILDVIIGILLLSNIGVTTIAIPLIVAFWMLFGGILRIGGAMTLQSYGVEKWWILLVTGILGILVSLIIFFSPLVGTAIVIALIGAYLMFYGIMLFVEAVTTKIPEIVDFIQK